MGIIFRARVWVPVAAGLIFFLSGPARSVASDAKKIDRHLADLETRAKRGNVQQEFELGHAYFYGRGVPQDFKKAAHWYEKAAKAGSAEAENQIGFLYQNGIGVRVDLERAAHWFQLSSASGLLLGKVNLAVCYLNGAGVPRNTSTARKLLMEAVEKGEGGGAAYLGRMELSGLDGPQNVPEAERWFRAGVRLDDPIAAYGLAYLDTSLNGHPHDLRKGAQLLRFSAGKGYVPAMHALGLLLINHPEIQQGETEARTLLQRASLAGYWRGTVLLGILARDGRGAPADAAAASYYFHLAALQGGPEAERVLAADLRALSNQLPGEIMSASAGRANEWFTQHRIPMQFAEDAKDDDRLSSSAL
jgi:TPR repeat protein